MITKVARPVCGYFRSLTRSGLFESAICCFAEPCVLLRNTSGGQLPQIKSLAHPRRAPMGQTRHFDRAPITSDLSPRNAAGLRDIAGWSAKRGARMRSEDCSRVRL